jgi:hypothetical protein
MVMGCQDKIELYENPPEYLLQQVEPYYPLAIKFVRDNEQVALSKGIPLLPQYLEIARRVGVKYPEKVRVYYVDQLPLPDNESLLFQMQRFGLDSPYLAGMTYGYGIWIKKSAKGDKLLLSHELIHVKQTEELGLEDITKRYFLQLKVFGYRDAPIEVEAYDNAHKYL